MAEDLTQQLCREIADCKCFLLQLDESTDTSDTPQSCVYIQMVFTDITVKEELSKLLPMKERTWGEFIFQAFKNSTYLISQYQFRAPLLYNIPVGNTRVSNATNSIIYLCSSVLL